MSPIIPISRHFDQPTMHQLIDADPVVQRYRTLFALFDWTATEPPAKPPGPGRPAHPPSAYIKALLVRIGEHLSSTPRFRAYLLDHPLLVLELGFRPYLDLHQPYGFAVSKTGQSRAPFECHPAQPGQPLACRAVCANRAGAASRNPRPGRSRGLRRQAHLCQRA